MRKFIIFISALIFVNTVSSQVYRDFWVNNIMTGAISENMKNYTPVLYKSTTEAGTYQAIVLSATGTTNNLGCNPTIAAINAALGNATATTDCPPGNLGVSDDPVIISGCNYSQKRTWIASDACGSTASVSRIVTWIVNNSSPFINLTIGPDPGCNPTAAEIETALGFATVTNSCGNVELTVATSPIQISGCTRSQTRSWTATDDCNNFSSATRFITWVEDLIPPTISITGTINNLGCNPPAAIINAALGNVTANDNCGSVSLLQSDETVISNGCNRSQTRRCTASDACGNTSSVSRIVTWTEDITPQVFNTVTNITQSPDPGMSTAVVNIIPPTVTDNCGGGQITRVRSDNLPINDPYPLGQTIITWTATDACGNVSSVIQTITIGDTQMPVINYCPVVSAQCFIENSTYTIPVLLASDNWGIQSIRFLITGATSREGGNNNASGIFNPGTSIIHWTVTDLAGNSVTCETTVDVDKVDVVVPDVYAANITPAIGLPNTIYIGYGGNSITLTANVTSSISPNSFSYKWTIGSPGGTKIGTGPTIIVNPSVTTTYYVSIKDENNCAPLSQSSKQVTVTDIRCGTNKVWVCEMQKNGTFKSVCIPTTKLPELPAGSYLGQCTTPLTRSMKIGEAIEVKNDLVITAAPNPSAGSFELKIMTTNIPEPIIIRTIDITGRVIDVKKKFAGQSIQLGKEYNPGIFIIEALQGNRRATIRVMKIGN